MKAIITLALKDLRLLSRDWFALFWIFIFPLLFALFFGAITGGDGGRSAIPLAVVDEDNSAGSKEFIAKLEKKSDAVTVHLMPRSQAQPAVRQGKQVAFIILKKGFGQANFFFGGDSPIMEMGIDPSRRAEAGFLQGLLMELTFSGLARQFTDPKESRKSLQNAIKQIEGAKGLDPAMTGQLRGLFRDFDKAIGKLKNPAMPAGGSFASPYKRIKQVNVQREGVRPLSPFEITFPSAILWGIIGCVTSFAISIVVERIGGTYLRLRIAPLSKTQVLAGKGLACFLASTLVTLVLLLFANVILNVRLGNPLTLTLAIVCTSACFVGIMMLLSTLGKTEQGVAGAGWGILMPFAMIGGAMIPLFFMPSWMQTASNISPIKWGIYALEGAIWRDFSLLDMLRPCGILLAIGVVCFSIGVRNLARIDR